MLEVEGPSDVEIDYFEGPSPVIWNFSVLGNAVIVGIKLGLQFLPGHIQGNPLKDNRIV